MGRNNCPHGFNARTCPECMEERCREWAEQRIDDMRAAAEHAPEVERADERPRIGESDQAGLEVFSR